jgi:hypothetical protein
VLGYLGRGGVEFCLLIGVFFFCLVGGLVFKRVKLTDSDAPSSDI